MKNSFPKLFFFRRFSFCYVQTHSRKLRCRLFSPWFARTSPRCICHRQRSATHSLKRKSGKIPVFLLSLLLLTACQPTPTEDVVTNKAEGRLEALIAADPFLGDYAYLLRTMKEDAKYVLDDKVEEALKHGIVGNDDEEW